MWRKGIQKENNMKPFVRILLFMSFFIVGMTFGKAYQKSSHFASQESISYDISENFQNNGCAKNTSSFSEWVGSLSAKDEPVLLSDNINEVISEIGKIEIKEIVPKKYRARSHVVKYKEVQLDEIEVLAEQTVQEMGLRKAYLQVEGVQIPTRFMI